MNGIRNVSLVGVGGQGILLASEILCRVALLAGRDVKKSEVHGMAQRGGSVVSQVRFGEKVHSPLIALGSTDILVSFEKLEALRFAHFLTPRGIAIVNEQEIRPVTVSTGQAEWPSDLDERLLATFARLDRVPALRIATELGNVRVVNVVMIGALSRRLDLESDLFRQAIEALVPEKVRERNLSAFEMGRSAVADSVGASQSS